VICIAARVRVRRRGEDPGSVDRGDVQARIAEIKRELRLL
jgi:hypothetical protein